jgi:hypothetical protein
MDRQADQEFRGWALASRGGLVPGIQRQPVSPAASAAATSVPVTADEGITVTNARQLLGSWWTIELDGQNVRAVRDDSDRPLGVKFEQYGTQLRWGANDIVNYHSATFSVSKEGQFLASQGTVTAVGTTGKGPQYLRTPRQWSRPPRHVSWPRPLPTHPSSCCSPAERSSRCTCPRSSSASVAGHN